MHFERERLFHPEKSAIDLPRIVHDTSIFAEIHVHTVTIKDNTSGAIHGVMRLIMSSYS